jgi:hypothetical protein
MKTNKLTSALLIFSLIGLGSQANAQLLKKLKEKVEERLEDHAIDQVEKGVDKGLEKTEEALWKKLTSGEKKKENEDGSENTDDSPFDMESMDTDEMQKRILEMMGGSAEPIEVAEAYSFTKKVVYDMRTSVDDGPGSMLYVLLMNPDQKYVGYQMTEISSKGETVQMPMEFTMIIDYDHAATVVLMEDEKMAQIIPMETLESVVEGEETENQSTVVKTGNTKDILGYRCEEYQIKSEDMDGSIWIAPDIEIYNQSFLKDFGNSAFALKSELMDLTGLTMEMDIRSFSGNSKKPVEMNMKVVSLEDEANEIEMSNYQALSLGSAFNQK